MNRYLLKMEKADHLQIHSFFIADIQKVREIFNELYSGSLTEEEPSSRGKRGIALKWNAGVASLATLFFDLTTQYQISDGQPYIKATTQQTAEFISQHFRDKDGRPFSVGSINTYLDPNKKDKKAKKYKVDIENSIPEAKKVPK